MTVTIPGEHFVRTDDTLTCTHGDGFVHTAQLEPGGQPVPGSCAAAVDDAAADDAAPEGLELADVLALGADAAHLLATVVDYGMPGLVRGTAGADRVHLTAASDRLTRAWGDVTLALTALRATSGAPAALAAEVPA